MPHQCVSCERRFDDGSKEMLSGCPDCGGNTFQYFKGEPPADPADSPPDRAGGSVVAETVGRATTTLRDAVSTATGDGFDAWPHQGDAEVEIDASQLETGDHAQTGSEAPRSETLDQPSPGPRDAEFVEDDPVTGREWPEDAVQSSARTDVVSGEELPDASAPENPTGDEGIDRDGEPDSVDQEGATHEESERPEPTEPVEEPVDHDGAAAETPDLQTLRDELNDQFEGIRIVDRGQYELNLRELYEREETIIALRGDGRYVIEPPESWRGDRDEG